jgi:hypothetical protein
VIVVEADSARYVKPRAWVEGILSGGAPVRFAWETIIDGQVAGPLITDAQWAALTMESGGTLYTTDRDVYRFPGLKWVNPLSRRPTLTSRSR